MTLDQMNSAKKLFQSCGNKCIYARISGDQCRNNTISQGTHSDKLGIVTFNSLCGPYDCKLHEKAFQGGDLSTGIPGLITTKSHKIEVMHSNHPIITNSQYQAHILLSFYLVNNSLNDTIYLQGLFRNVIFTIYAEITRAAIPQNSF